MSRKSLENRIAEVLSVGDTVYIDEGGTLQPAKVAAIWEEGILTSEGWLYYRHHRKRWWLTQCGMAAVKGGTVHGE